ncbi:hypothetical protein EVAR_87944_1 [Eumeta japonica]|uniref:Uncharacterized protein n=1 Tax=Eumeta variegata TaxID=151549 RepID=A0A4C1VFC8_EUMVA|nr:hypothetical protein EVAR_87944_1 [Eumeta japonica]
MCLVGMKHEGSVGAAQAFPTPSPASRPRPAAESRARRIISKKKGPVGSPSVRHGTPDGRALRPGTGRRLKAER